MKFLIFLFIFLCLPLVIAGSVPQASVEYYLNQTELPICEDELETCVNEYNNLLEDFKDGNNCKGLSQMLKSMNELLGEERDECLKEIGALEVYKIGFFSMGAFLLITALFLIYSSFKDGKRNTKK